MAKLIIRALGVTTALAATFGVALTASAQDAPPSISGDVPEAIDEIFFNKVGPYDSNRSIFSYSNFLSGLRGFPERRILLDATAINEATVFLLEEQSELDPTIRVPDLANPYTTSVQFLPGLQSSGQISGSEFIFEPALFP